MTIVYDYICPIITYWFLNILYKFEHLIKYKREKLYHRILTKYLGSFSLIYRPDFLKT